MTNKYPLNTKLISDIGAYKYEGSIHLIAFVMQSLTHWSFDSNHTKWNVSTQIWPSDISYRPTLKDKIIVDEKKKLIYVIQNDQSTYYVQKIHVMKMRDNNEFELSNDEISVPQHICNVAFIRSAENIIYAFDSVIIMFCRNAERYIWCLI